MDCLTPTLTLSPVPLWIPFLCGFLLAAVLGLVLQAVLLMVCLRADLWRLLEELSEKEDSRR